MEHMAKMGAVWNKSLCGEESRIEIAGMLLIEFLSKVQNINLFNSSNLGTALGFPTYFQARSSV